MKRAALALGLLISTATSAADPSKTSRLVGSTFLARNRPLVGATIRVTSATDAAMYVTATDGRGQFDVDALPEGTYDVEARREGYETVVKSGIVLQSPYRPVVELLMKPGAAGSSAAAESPRDAAPVALSGSARERGIGPLVDASIHLAREDGADDPRKVESKGEGVFDAGSLPPGQWRLTARAVGFLSLHTDLRLERDTRLTLILVRQPGDYDPAPLDLMPAEEPLPPPGLEPGTARGAPK